MPDALVNNNQTLYQSPHKVKLSANHARLEIIQYGEPLPPGQRPRNFDELVDFLVEYRITVKSTPDGLLFTGGTTEQRQRIVDCLNGCVWTYGNLRLFLDGELLDINGRKYVPRTKPLVPKPLVQVQN